MNHMVDAEHGIVCRRPGDPLGYFGWPSIARMEDGTLVAASSGLRARHVCPWGKTVLHFSGDDGRTWSDSVIVNDSPIDDRDAGIISLGGRSLLVSWFTYDTRTYLARGREAIQKQMYTTEELDRIIELTATWEDAVVDRHLGSWVRLRENGSRWGEAVRVPVSAPHGPIRLARGDLLYFGKGVEAEGAYLINGAISAVISTDGGNTWEELGDVPIPPDTEHANYHEPHVVELASGKIIGMIRYQHSANVKTYESFGMFQTESDDGGKTWSVARPVDGVSGSPPHLLRHSSGAVVCVYGYRQGPYGQRAMISYDEGRTWDIGYILRNDGPDRDLGYPASVELADGSIMTVYYQKYAADEKASLLWTRWKLPAP